MANELKMQVVFSMIEKVTAPLKKIGSGAGAAGRALKETRYRLRELEKQQKDLNSARELAGKVRSSHTAFSAAKKELEDLAAKMRGMENPTRAMTRSFDAAQSKVRNLHAEGEKYRTQLREVSGRLSEAGISADKYGATQRALQSSIAATNTQLTAQKEKLAASERLHRRQDQLRARAARMTASGVAATATGTAVGIPLVAGLKEAKHYETETGRVRALGLGDTASAEAVKFAREMKTYGTSQLDNLQLLRDGITAFGDTHHAEMVAPVLAKMKFANHAFYGEAEGADNERKFMDMLKVIEMRNGTKDIATFTRQANMVQQVLTATGGRVGPEEWLNLIKTGGIAAKGIKDEAFYYQMESLVQEMGGNRVGTSMMSAYQNLYQGRTTKRSIAMLADLGLIGDASKVKHDKAGQVSFLNPGAIKGAELFRENQFEWMEKVLLPSLAAKGITDEKGILDAIGGIFSNRTAAQLFSTMYQQRTQIHKNEQLNRGAANIDKLDKLGRGTASGKELEALSKLADLKLKLGELILLLYTSALQIATKAIEGFTGFMQRNPAMAQALVIGLSSLAAILVVVGPLLLAVASVLGPFAVLQFVFSRIGLSGGMVIAALRGIGTAFMWLGRVFLFNPIGLAITAIVGAVYLIYTYWDPIVAFFKNVWQQIGATFSGGLSGILAQILNWSPLGRFYLAFAQVMSWFGIELPGKFSDFGVMLLRGLANGIVSGLGLVKDTLMSAGSSIIGWFKDKLGIRSPSRIFAELGNYTMQGLALGLQRGQDGPLATIGQLAGKLTAAGAAVTIGGASLPAMAFDTRPPLAAAAPPSVVYQGDSIQIIVHAAPGMDEQALARAVAAELDRRDLARDSRQRARLADFD